MNRPGDSGPAPDRSTLLVTDVERIPAVLRAGGRPLPAGIPRRPGRVVLTGLGSSRYAALVVAPYLRDAGHSVVVEHASTAHPAPVGPGDLVVGISASGRTRETVRALERASAAGAWTMAVANADETPLARTAVASLALEAGAEASGVASTTFAATVAALAELAAALGAALHPAVIRAAAADATEALLVARSTWLDPAADLLAPGRPVHVIADAAELGAAEQAALMLRECPRLDAFATDAGDWLHVGLYTALPGTPTLLFPGTPYDAELVSTVLGRGGQVVAVGDPLEGATTVVPLANADPVARSIAAAAGTTLLAAELWRRCVGR